MFMKKILFVLTFSLLISACSPSKVDPLLKYRGQSAEQLFHAAKKDLKAENYSDAVKDLEALEALYPFGRYSQQGQLDIIYAYYKSSDEASALAAADRYIRLNPRGPHTDYAYYMKAIVSFDQGFTWLQRKFGSDPAVRDLSDKKSAFLALNQLVKQFPNSPYAQDATYRMAYIRNLFARENVDMARFYMKRKAYLAAANRASYVVEHYGQSPQRAAALQIMAKAYQKLGLTDLAKNSQRILQANSQ
jgi:outer membrane protein assembly factor BamD